MDDPPVRWRCDQGTVEAVSEWQTLLCCSCVVLAAIASVKGLPAIEALVALCGMDAIPSKARYQDEAKNILAGSPLLAMLSTSTLGSDGQVVATSPNGPTLPEKAADQYRLHAGMVAAAAIAPALDQLNMEHAYTLEDFQSLAARSPVVPPGREDTFGRGLYAGYRRDMVTAMHILMPQFQHLVRVQLKGAGCLTTTHDADGIDMEVGLSTLIERAEMVDVFGEDLKFAIKALMCDQTGPNLRNDVAHGLADDGRMDSALGLYTWWLVLRIVIEQWWLAHRQSASAAGGPATDSSDIKGAAE
jgi:hypothetical protein